MRELKHEDGELRNNQGMKEESRQRVARAVTIIAIIIIIILCNNKGCRSLCLTSQNQDQKYALAM